ncbi:MAG: hypothetical protein C0510_03165 [Erythrobacter sp.]|nr:hypothetical protein [Erythrobacter sp.]
MIEMPPEPPPRQEQVIEHRLIECGLDARGVSVKYEDYLQSIEIVIGPKAGATTKHFACIKEAAGYEIVTFEDREMFAAYSDFASELARPQMLATFESRLKETGLWEGFPDRRDFGSLEDYARALEVHAGVPPGSALRISGNGILFDPAREGQNPADFVERYSDLLAVVAYASTKERLSFGFIGNERIAD